MAQTHVFTREITHCMSTQHHQAKLALCHVCTKQWWWLLLSLITHKRNMKGNFSDMCMGVWLWRVTWISISRAQGINGSVPDPFGCLLYLYARSLSNPSWIQEEGRRNCLEDEKAWTREVVMEFWLALGVWMFNVCGSDPPSRPIMVFISTPFPWGLTQRGNKQGAKLM